MRRFRPRGVLYLILVTALTAAIVGCPPTDPVGELPSSYVAPTSASASPSVTTPGPSITTADYTVPDFSPGPLARPAGRPGPSITTAGYAVPDFSRKPVAQPRVRPEPTEQAAEPVGPDEPAMAAAAAGQDALSGAIVGEWVDKNNRERRIQFFETGSGMMLSDEGGFTATYYSFVDQDTIRLVDGSGEMDLTLDGDVLTVRFRRLGRPPFRYLTGEVAEFRRAPPAR